MQYYQTKVGKIRGSSFNEVHRKAKAIYDVICGKSRRRPYIRSRYFKKQKIFLNLFWEHLMQKENWRDRLRRIAFYEAALEVIQMSSKPPEIRENPNKLGEFLYRFHGKTKQGDGFFIQIKETKKRKQRFLISIFPN